MADWTVTITVTVTVTLTLTIKKEKVECFDLNLCFNCILKWAMRCEATLDVSVKTVTVLS